MKMCGINVISTYIFWIHHEEEEGVFDFSGRKNLRKFIELCQKHHIYVILRIGPFDHGEVRNGGLPDWLYGKSFEVRKLNDGFLYYVKRLYTEIAGQVQGLLYKDGGPIIAAQIDNEYMHSSAAWEITTGIADEWIFGGDDGEAYMYALRDLAKECGIVTPFYTCTGWGGAITPDEMLPLWGGYAYRPWLFYAERGEHPVTEEYIYPEGMHLSCEEMGKEQDKFALAVIIFRLLNNGIHPFSGTPRKNDAEMLTIQNRIENYHYAYGLWPDKYQAPHPYSLHEYFDKATLEMFERAFTKGADRPTAYEWQEHLWKLMHNLRQCKNNPNHVYFTSKGCGLCMSEAKFQQEICNIQKQKQTPETIRGIEIADLSDEKIKKDKAEKRAFDHKMQNISYGILTAYMLFFGFLYQIILPFKEFFKDIGIGIQAFISTLIMFGINRFIHKYGSVFPLLQNREITNMLQVYALICIIVSLVSINDIPKNILDLTL